MADNYEIDVTIDEIFGTGISSVEQTVESHEPNGVNEVTVTLTNGQTSVFKVRNGDSSGKPTPVSLVSEMTNPAEIYLYTGSEEGYVKGNIYCYKNNEWTDVGTYGGMLVDEELDADSDNAVANKAITEAINEVKADTNALIAAVGSPMVASTVSAMTDHTKIYVYTGSETSYTYGHWYYWNGAYWEDGGVYQSDGLNTDKTLTVPNQAADAQKTGQEISDLKSAIDDIEEQIEGGTEPADGSITIDKLANDVLELIDNGAISDDVKVALMNLLNHVAFIDENGQIYLNTLERALNNGQILTSYTVTNTLTHVSTSNLSEQVYENRKYVAQLSADTGYKISSVTVTMGGVSSSSYYDSSTKTVTIPSVTGDIVITAVAEVSQDANTIEISAPEIHFIKAGDSLQTSAILTPASASDTIIWSSSNPSVATVDNNGLITAVGDGTATITARGNSVSGICSVSVNTASSYTQYDWIKQKVNSAVSTGITVAPSSECKYRVTFKALSSITMSEQSCLFGDNTKSIALWYRSADDNINITANDGKSTGYYTAITRDEYHTIEISGGDIYVDGVLSTTLTKGTITSASVISIFKRPDNGNTFKGVVKRMTIIDSSDKIVGDFVPVEDSSDSSLGMFNIIDGTYHKGGSITPFEVGND